MPEGDCFPKYANFTFVLASKRNIIFDKKNAIFYKHDLKKNSKDKM